jgi:hypothetical protein
VIDERPYSEEMCHLLDGLQLLTDIADVARHRVVEYRLRRSDYVLYYWEVAKHRPTATGLPEYAATPVRQGPETTVIVEPRS